MIRLACAHAIDAGPLAHRALDVVLAPRVEQFFEIGIVPRPPELPVGEDPRLAPFHPARPLVWPQDRLARELNGDRRALASLPRMAIRSPTHPWASWHSIDAIHVPIGAAVGADRVQEDARVAYILAAIGPLAPLVFHDQVIVAIFLVGGDVAEAVASDVEQAVCDPKHPARVVVLRVLEPGGEASSGRAR